MNTYPDYVRFTSWNSVTYALLSSSMMMRTTGWRQGNFLQYQGRRSDDGFHGVAVQRGRRHYMFQMSGYSSFNLMDMAKADDVKCTRLDLQRTIRRPRGYNARNYYDDLQNDDTNTRKLSIVQSSMGDTLYIGDRHSDTFIRLYEKKIDELIWLRLEIEIKGQTADKSYNAWREKSATFTEIYDTLLTRFKIPEDILKWFSSGRDTAGELLKRTVDKEKENQVRWLLNLHDTIVKMANDHDTGDIVRNWLDNLVQNLDSHNA